MHDYVCHAEERVPDPKLSRCRRRWRSRNYANAGLGTVSSVPTGPSHGLPPSSARCDRDEASSGRPAQRLRRLPAAVGHAAREWRWQELLRSDRMPRRHRCAAPCLNRMYACLSVIGCFRTGSRSGMKWSGLSHKWRCRCNNHGTTRSNEPAGILRSLITHRTMPACPAREPADRGVSPPRKWRGYSQVGARPRRWVDDPET